MFGFRPQGLTKLELRIIGNQVEIMTALAALTATDDRILNRLRDALRRTGDFLNEQMAHAPDR